MGQIFTDVIDGEFDGGYYLSAKNPSSSSSPASKGIIFKPRSHFNVIMPPYNNNNNNTTNNVRCSIGPDYVVPFILVVLTLS